MFDFLNPPPVFVEIGHSSLQAVVGGQSIEVPLERLENGRLSPACRERLLRRWREFLKPSEWQARRRAFCAIGARGISLRRLALPPTAKKDLPRVLRLQVEAEFPLPPDQMAWGYYPINHQNLTGNGGAVGQEVVVAAARSEVVAEYAELFTACGLSPVFTVGALARNRLCPQAPGFYAILDVGRRHSELVSFENGAPSALRILPWGGDNLTEAVARRLGITGAEAEQLKIQWGRQAGANGEVGKQVQAALREELEALAITLHRNWIGQKLFLSGKSAQCKEISSWFSQAFGGGVACESLETAPSEGRSAAVLGLQRACDQEGGTPPLVLQLAQATGAEGLAQPAHWQWAVLAVMLAGAAFLLRYAESWVQRPRLARRLAQLQVYREQLPKIDRELDFLQYLQTNEPPYLDAIAMVAKAAPQGMRLDSFSMNRRGEASLKVALQNPQQAVDFRSKLNEAGFFAAVVPDEQAPSADRSKLSVRFSLQWNPALAAKVIHERLASTNAPPPSQEKVVKGQTNAPGRERPVPVAAGSSGTNPPSDRGRTVPAPAGAGRASTNATTAAADRGRAVPAPAGASHRGNQATNADGTGTVVRPPQRGKE